MSSTVLVDCRWLSLGGAGRVTELLLRGLAEVRPPGRWRLWGSEAVRRWEWRGAEVVVTTADPRALRSQRSWFDVPECDLAVFLHQMRPLRAIPALTLVLDTIPLRFPANPVDRAVKAFFLRRVGRLSREVLTISEYSRACIVRDLRVPAERVTVLPLPYDDEFSAAVERLRAGIPPTDTALYVGRFASHKNLDRLVAAFARTQFCASGGRLRLVGGSPREVQLLRESMGSEARASIDVRPECSQEELHAVFASALFLVQPSLEEGFGLPVREALSCGLPVCVSDGGALPEITANLADMVETFPATSTQSMTAALDACAARARARRSEGMRPLTASDLGTPTTRDFAARFVEVVERTMR